jgi:hypothetical protein
MQEVAVGGGVSEAKGSPNGQAFGASQASGAGGLYPSEECGRTVL